MVSEDIPNRLIDISEYKQKKLERDIEEQKDRRKKAAERMLDISDKDVLYLRIEELENRLNKLMEYTQDLYFTAKSFEEELEVQRNRTVFLLNALQKLTVWTGYEK